MACNSEGREREREMYELEIVVERLGDERSIGGQAVPLQLINDLRHIGGEVLPVQPLHHFQPNGVVSLTG